MTKDLIFDLHFTETVVKPLTVVGEEFCRVHGNEATPGLYHMAACEGLHIRFKDASVRDRMVEFAGF